MTNQQLPPQKGQIPSGNTSPSRWNRYSDKLSPVYSTLLQKFFRLKTKLVDLILGVLGVILWTLLLTTIVWWLLAIVVWPAMDAPYNKKSVALNQYNNNILEVWSPSVIQGGTAPSEIRFSLWQEDIPSKPITVEVTIPDEFIVQAPTTDLAQSASTGLGDPLSQPITVEATILAQSNVLTTTTHPTQSIGIKFGGQLKQESVYIQLINAHQSRKLGVSQQELKIKVSGTDEQPSSSFSVPIGAEGTWRYTLRTLGGIGPEKIPFFPFATLLVSIGGLWLKHNEEHHRQAEKDITRIRAENLFETVRRALQRGDMMAAKQGLDRMKQNNLMNNVTESDWRKVEQLIEFSQGKSALTGKFDFAEPWLEETAGVLIYVAENNPFDRTKISALLRTIPLDRFGDERRQRLRVAIEVLGSSDLAVGVTWPPPPFAQQELSDLSQKKGYKNPFPKDRAEDEAPLLFRKEDSLFWPEHPLLKELVQVNDTTIVIGNHGSGCTALAMAVGKYYSQTKGPPPFTCYISGTPSKQEIRLALANRLLQFLEYNPHYLILMGNEQKSLAAQTLVSEISKNLLLSKLEAATHQEGWLEKTENDKDKRKIWKAEAQAHLNLLLAAVKDSEITPLVDNAWPMALIHCLRLLKFEDTILISIDAGDAFSREWYHNVIAPHHQIWNEQGLHSIIFTTPAAYNTAKIKPTLLPQTKALQWQAEELGKMLHARWVAANGRIPISQLFSDNARTELLDQAKGNPRQLIHLWREILVKRRSPIPVEIAAVTKAAEDLSDDI